MAAGQKRRSKDPVWRAKRNATARKRSRAQRRDSALVAKFVLIDSRGSDRKAGRENDLTREVVERLLAKPCRYCGETQLRMTLDRKDNNVGHVVRNVVPCCERCNYLRRDMPYEAWLALVPTIRAVRIAGLFGSWVGGIHRRKTSGE